MKIPDETKRFTCRTCQRETGHRPLATGSIKGSERKLELNKTSDQTFQVVQCRDCGTTTYCIDTRVHPGPTMGDSWIQETIFYPPSPKRTRPSWYDSLSEEFRKILAEVYSAIDHDLFFLASIGTRTALDQLIVKEIGDVGTFDQKIQRLVRNNIIEKDEKELLLPVIDAGSASAHRNYKPDSKAIAHMMDILETVFFKLLVQPSIKADLKSKAQHLMQTTPKRKRA